MGRCSFSFGKYCQIVPLGGLCQFILRPSIRESTCLPTHVLVAWFTKFLDFCQSGNVILTCIYLVLSCVECLIYLKAFAFPFFFFFFDCEFLSFYLAFFYSVVALLKIDVIKLYV